MGRPKFNFNTRPGRPGQYGPGNKMYDDWAGQSQVVDGVRYTPGNNSQGEFTTEFYKNSQFFDEYMKATKTTNFNSKKDARAMNEWVMKNKGVDMYNTTGSPAAPEEKKENWSLPEARDYNLDFSSTDFKMEELDGLKEYDTDATRKEINKAESLSKDPGTFGSYLDRLRGKVSKPNKMMVNKQLERDIKVNKKQIKKAAAFNPDPIKMTSFKDANIPKPAKPDKKRLPNKLKRRINKKVERKVNRKVESKQNNRPNKEIDRNKIERKTRRNVTRRMKKNYSKR